MQTMSEFAVDFNLSTRDEIIAKNVGGYSYGFTGTHDDGLRFF